MTYAERLLAEHEHRPWPLPASPWVMRQVWHDLLFAHWPLPPDVLRAVVPPQLALDTYNDLGWISVVPFGMRDVVPRPAFPVPWLSHFLEMNVRTYVRVGDKPGVYFFSLDASNPVAVAVARKWYHLPYYHARMRWGRRRGAVVYHSYRTHRGAPPAEFRATYAPISEVFRAEPGSLEAWLAERYCLYTIGPGGRVLRGEIHHAPWPLQWAEVEIETNTMLLPHGLHLPDEGRRPALAHFARRLETLEWAIEEVRGEG